ncbi:uncharacterized protein LY79DRAFT_282862 [Colletotrichum navitas]|uniref:Uncharacterized protein n=1 Tax=Colletotrichum navitas TaxID=681940 RepID=A0AAD8VB70_9PEZI|nr:uncharacterized protein LY79DRAFT_282862 [Colletotrichum navitas]KAK1598175.1 hypothetical protein LY79DRAFT_282862 [Colletotrichum navitas]
MLQALDSSLAVEQLQSSLAYQEQHNKPCFTKMKQPTIMNKATVQRAVTPVSRSTQAAWQPLVATPKAAAARHMVAIDRPWGREQKVRQTRGASVPQAGNERVQDPFQYWLVEAIIDQPYNAVGEVKMPLQKASNTWPDQDGRDISPVRATASGSEMYESGSR